MRNRILHLLPVLIGLGGCNPFWPPHGKGGLAETHPPAQTDQSAPTYVALADLVDELEALKKEGAHARFPAKVAEAEQMVVRIRRALGGGLDQDAALDVVQLRHEIGTLAEQLHTEADS